MNLARLSRSPRRLHRETLAEQLGALCLAVAGHRNTAQFICCCGALAVLYMVVL